jgi:hypothetical protein
MSRDARPSPPLCPSAQPDWQGAVAIGVVGGSAAEPRVRPLEHPLPVTPALLELARPVEPTEVFRFAAPCRCNGCGHFSGSRCGLAAKVVRMTPEVTAELPECDIRPRCRWFGQEGREACMRCPGVATHDANISAELRAAADPTVPVPC